MNPCACGCGGLTTTTFINGHNNRKTFEERFVVSDEGFDTPCWCWTGDTNNYGYGMVTTYAEDGTRRRQTAHRTLYRRDRGEIPEGLDLDHLCRVRHCVNPHHLEVVTRAVNAQRGCRAKLTEGRVVAMRMFPALSHSMIGDLFGVTSVAVSDARRHRSWKNV